MATLDTDLEVYWIGEGRITGFNHCLPYLPQTQRVHFPHEGGETFIPTEHESLASNLELIDIE